MTLGEIIKTYRKENDLSMAEFAKRCNVSKAYIGFLEKGINPKTNKPIIPSIQVVKSISDAMHFDFNELVAIMDGDVTVFSSENKSEAVRIPVVGDVAAGIPIEAIENILDWEEIPESMARLGEHFGLRIKGQSMEPRIVEGDVVIVRQQPDAESGDIVIVKVNGDSATCKRLMKYNDGITLIPLNPSYPPMHYTAEEVQSKPVAIIGKVVELRGKF